MSSADDFNGRDDGRRFLFWPYRVRYVTGLKWTQLRRWVIRRLTPGRSKAVIYKQVHGTPAMGGTMLVFQPNGMRLGHQRYLVLSKRGGMEMGTVEWSNQWNRPRFKAHHEAIFDQACIAEIYAAMKGLK